MKIVRKGFETSKVDNEFVMGKLYQMRNKMMCYCNC